MANAKSIDTDSMEAGNNIANVINRLVMQYKSHMKFKMYIRKPILEIENKN